MKGALRHAHGASDATIAILTLRHNTRETTHCMAQMARKAHMAHNAKGRAFSTFCCLFIYLFFTSKSA